MDDETPKDVRNKSKGDKPDLTPGPQPGDLPPGRAAPARLPTPVLLKQLQTAIDRIKRAKSSK
jgi:hypothetical protein